MSDIVAYCDQVEQLLEQKRISIENSSVKKLRDSFQAFQIYFENVYNILIRKGLIQEDPYKYDEKISEVDAPSDDAYLDSEEQEKLNTRLSQYHTRLEFLNNYYEYSVDFLNLARLKRIVKFLKYINWNQVTETAVSPTTRALANFFSKIRRGTDPLSTGIINDSLAQIEKMLKTASSALSEMAAYQKERYKLELRRRLVPRLGLFEQAGEDKIDAALQKAKHLFTGSMGSNIPFYPDLVKETLLEDYTGEGAELKKQVIESLRVAEKKQVKEKKEDTYRTILVQAVRYLASCGLQLEDAFNKLAEAQGILESQELTLVRRIRRWLRKMLGRGEEHRVYEIEYFDVATSTNKQEKVPYQEYVDDTKRLIQLFAGLSSKASPLYRKLENSPEEKIYHLLNQNLINLQLTHRRMHGLINVFKAKLPKDKRSKVRGIKLELNAIKNSIVKANQKKHEFVAFKEEEEQMKRLGLKKEST